MEYQRAEEIVKSSDHFQILHKSKAIWIENLNPDKETAVVASGPQFQEKYTVPVRELEEIHGKH